jgi:hypothetical protein
MGQSRGGLPLFLLINRREGERTVGDKILEKERRAVTEREARREGERKRKKKETRGKKKKPKESRTEEGGFRV